MDPVLLTDFLKELGEFILELFIPTRFFPLALVLPSVPSSVGILSVFLQALFVHVDIGFYIAGRGSGPHDFADRLINISSQG